MITVYRGELYHYGMPKRSGRYPWGSGANPFHHSGKKGLSRSQKKAQKKAQEKIKVQLSKRKASLEISKKETETTPVNQNDRSFGKVERPSKERKAEIINSGDPQLINKYKEHLTTHEINQAIGKVRASEAIEAMAKSSQQTGLNKVSDILDTGVKVADNVEKGIKIYNTVAKVTNAVSPEPILPTARDYSHLDIAEYKKKKYDAERTKIHALNALDKRSKTKTQEQTEKLKQETDLTNAKTENLRSTREFTEEKARTREYLNAKEAERKAAASAEKQAKKEAKQAEKQAKKEAKQAKKESKKEFNDFLDKMDATSEQRRRDLNISSEKEFNNYINDAAAERAVTKSNIDSGKEYTDQMLEYMKRMNK